MKKSIIKNISVLLMFVLFMSTFFGVSAQAISTLCVEDHFTNLVTTGVDPSKVIRTPPSEYSCSYVAMSMLLSFYDSYWRDDFIVSADGINETDWEQGIYDPSTDTLIETFNASEEAGDWDSYTKRIGNNYRDFITHPDYDHYLESYLISLAKEINLCDEDDTVFGLKGYEVVDFLEYYLYDVRGFTEDQITVHMQRELNLEGGDEALFEQMVNHINAGFPLIYAGSDLTIDFSQIEFFDQIENQTGGHAMIAYSLDGDRENPTDINLHTGWSGNEHIQSVNGTEYNVWNVIIWLEIDEEKLPHQCTNAYRDPTNTQTFCACEIYEKHPAHNSNHLYRNANDSDSHFLVCHCGEKTNVEAHDLTYLDSNPVFHREKCEDCSYMDFANHEYTNFLSYTSTTHDAACGCGATTTEEHYAHRFEPLDNSLHTVYCECGKEWTSPHVVKSGSYTGGNKYALCIACKALVTVGMSHHQAIGNLPCSENGSFILPSGIIVLVDEDIEAYFAGTLEFYYPDENLETE